ncbi:GAF and ANTAR domain-containing protein [Amycolatopsis thermoflava]|uniref:GAF and ANTAR domain-containing protein n=1 Tax=Amycolatopsis thermoflava TaxID=84480 RepID=UPI003D70C628
MTGRGDSLARVWEWANERAASLGTAVSVRVLCDTAVARLEVSGVAVMVGSGEAWPETAESTDVLATRLAELAVTVGEGPCLDAGRDGGPVLVADLNSPSSQRRWPLFAPLAVEAGAGSLFALPMCLGAIRVGVLALHRERAAGLAPAKLADSLTFAELVLRLLLDAQSANGPATEAELPLQSLQVHQATGMIAGQLDVSMDDAFARLRARAFADRRPLTELSADVVARVVRFDR